jgi:subtilase family serine protease
MSSRVIRRGRTCAIVAMAGAMVAGMGTIQIAQAAQRAHATTTVLSGSRPAFLGDSRDLGAVSGARAVDFEVLLALPHQSAVEAEVQALSTPGSASFRKYLTDSQFRAAYSPSTRSVAAVESWVRGAGLKVKSVARSRLYVEVTGTMAQAEKLVGTKLHTYVYQGLDLAEPVGNYRIPASLGAIVAGIVNLDDTALLQKPQNITASAVAAATAKAEATASSTASASPDQTLPGPPPGAYYGVQPCSAYYGQKVATDKPSAYGQKWPYTICGYNADQYQKAFGLSKSIQNGNDGSGVTVAITDAYAAPTILSDADTFSAQNNLPAFKTGQFTQLVPSADGYSDVGVCGAQGWYGEETLDVEAVHSMAPGANVLYAGGANCGAGLNTAWATVIDQHLASVVTDSWNYGTEMLPKGLVNFFNEFLLEAATTGITVMFSSGDSGDEVAATGTRQVGIPASDPYATAVGGTSTEIGKKGNIVFQTGWSNFYSQLGKGGKNWKPKPPGVFSSGSGGGTSVRFPEPFYQVGVVPTSISEYNGATPMRAVPDVSMPADPNTGLRVGETQQFSTGTFYATYRIGGTSLSSPLFAGVVADAVQFNGAAIGFINPLLYEDVDTSAITDVLATSGPQSTVRTNLTDVANPSSPLSWELQTIGVATTIFSGPGYDDQTGVGTPNGTFFLRAMKFPS